LLKVWLRYDNRYSYYRIIIIANIIVIVIVTIYNTNTDIQTGRVPLSVRKALIILGNACVSHVRLHLPFPLFAKVVGVIATNRYIQKLSLKFRTAGKISMMQSQLILNTFSNIGSNSDEIPESHFTKLLTQSSIDHVANNAAVCLCKLNQLTIYGWPEYPINVKGGMNINSEEYCKRLLGFMGSSLQSLSFLDSSPNGLFGVIENSCASLRHLKIEGAQNPSDLVKYHSSLLEDLSLLNTGIILKGKLQLPNLISLEMSDCDLLKSHVNDIIQPSQSKWRSAADVIQSIKAMPVSLMELSYRMSSEFANIFITSVGLHLPNLNVLKLTMSDYQDVPNHIEPSTITTLRDGCPYLTNLEIIDSEIKFESSSFQLLSSYPNLQKIKMRYEDDYVDVLPQMLKESRSLSYIEFFECQDDIIAEEGEGYWVNMENKIDAIVHRFPHVQITLQNIIPFED